VGRSAFLDARHRAHARVEDLIRTGKDTGLGRFASRDLANNTIWLSALMIATDLIAGAQPLLPDGALAEAEEVALSAPARRRATQPRRTRATTAHRNQHWPWASSSRPSPDLRRYPPRRPDPSHLNSEQRPMDRAHHHDKKRSDARLNSPTPNDQPHE